MCKVLGFSNTSKIKKASKFVNTCLDVLAQYDQDGLGYELVGNNGRYGEREIGTRLKFNRNTKVKDAVFSPKQGEAWGMVPDTLTGPAIFHSRTSTNSVSVENTHPLRKDGYSLIHNGVVSNIGPKYDMITTNDTEHLLHYLTTSTLDTLAASLTGYYAALYLTPEDNLGVIVDRIAPLVCAYSEALETWVFATHDDIIGEIFKAMKWDCPPIKDVAADIAFTINAANEVMSMQNIKSLGYTKKEAIKASKSLGRELDSNIIDATRGEGLAEESPDFVSFVDDIMFTNDPDYLVFDTNGHIVTKEDFRRLTTTEISQLLVSDSRGIEYSAQTWLNKA